MKINVIYGGKSAEHEVSITSAYHIIKNINYNSHQVMPIYITPNGKWLKGNMITSKKNIVGLEEFKKMAQEPFHFVELMDRGSLAFPVLHGPNGEDGTIQGLFELMEIPYVGAGVLASASGMDKIVSKILFKNAGIPIVPYEVLLLSNWNKNCNEELNRIINSLKFPMFVKPANLGSSVGISEAKDARELKKSIDLAIKYDYRVLIEEGVKSTEVEVAILGNDIVKTSVVGAIVKNQQFYDYNSKYLSEEVKLQIPAEIPQDITKMIQEYAIKAYKSIDGSGLSRVDFFLTEAHDVYINEINTFPGFTSTSMYPKLWKASGVSYEELIETLIQIAIDKYESKKMLKKSIT